MARQILQGALDRSQKFNNVSLQKTQAVVSSARFKQAVRKNRSKQYLNAMTKLDAGGHVANRQQVEDIVKAIAEEFDVLDMDITGVMKGIVAPCYLGVPYEVHTLDYAAQIIEHYPSGKRLPGDLEKARGIAMRGGYAFIEVYDDFLCAVSNTGSISLVEL